MILEKKIEFFLFLNIFLSTIGMVINPNKQINGILTINQISKYVDGKFLEYIVVPIVMVPTLLKWFKLIFKVSKNRNGSIKKVGFKTNVKIVNENKNNKHLS